MPGSRRLAPRLAALSSVAMEAASAVSDSGQVQVEADEKVKKPKKPHKVK